MKENNLNRTELAQKLGVTKGYVSQVLNGDFDHKISKLVELAISSGKAPLMRFVDMAEYIKSDIENMSYEIIPMYRTPVVSFNPNSYYNNFYNVDLDYKTISEVVAV